MADEHKWLKQKSDFWEANQQAWKDAMKVYEADLRKLRSDHFLKQRQSGESDDQFAERLSLADFMPILSVVADTYAGRMLEAEKQIRRIWQREDSVEGLGSTSDPSTLAGRLWRSADGGKTSWLTMVEDAIIMLVVLKTHYAVVRGVVRDKAGKVVREPSSRIIEPWAVEDAIYDGDALVNCKVYHEVDIRKDVKQMKDKRKRYTLYYPEGFEVWELKGEKEKQDRIIQQLTPYGIVDGRPFYFYKTKERRQKILPIFENTLSLRRKPGCNLADKNLVLFNQESERDNIMRVANTPRLQFVGDFGRYTKFLKENDAGKNILPLDPGSSRDHKYLAPSMDSGDIATRVIEQKVQALFLAAFRYYEDAVRGKTRTATEVEQDSAGENGFLNVLATSADYLENELGWRYEQIQFPNKPELWGQFKVERQKDFAPVNEREETDMIIKRYFGSHTPVLTQDAEVELTCAMYEQDGLTVDKDAIIAEVTAKRGERDVERDRKAVERDRAKVLAEADGAEIQARQREIQLAAAGA